MTLDIALKLCAVRSCDIFVTALAKKCSQVSYNRRYKYNLIYRPPLTNCY